MKPTRYTQEMVEEYTKRGWWNSTTLADIYDQNAFLYPDKEAMVGYWKGERRSVTWATFKKMTDRLALGFLELGLKRDERVLCQLPNCIENVAVRIALEKAGLIYCCSAINSWESENRRFIERLEPVAVVSLLEYHNRRNYKLFKDLRDSERYPAFKHLFLIDPEEETPDDAASIAKMMQIPLDEKYAADYLRRTQVDAYEVSHIATTTGTTGLPKLIELSANSLRIHGRAITERWNITSNDIGFTTALLWTGPSNPVILGIPQVGGTLILMESFDPGEALKIIERERATYYAGLPSQIIDMANHPEFGEQEAGSLRFFSFAGAPFPAGSARDCEERFKRPLVNYYGAMDSFMLFCSEPNDPPEIRWGSVGKVAPSWDEFKIVDPKTGEKVPQGKEGLLYWRGPTGSGGYYRDIERTKEVWGALGLEGWYNTEDIAKVDEEGRVWLVGRARDMILRGGQNIFPLEIEELLSTHPKVMNASIVPMPDPRLGEKVCAYVIPKKGDVFSFEEMTAYLEEKGFAKYKWPERLEIIQSFPMIGAKVDKRVLISDICKKLLKESKVSKEIIESFIETGKLRSEQIEL